MEITWMGQAGLLFENDGFNVMIDPYLSDSVKEIEPQNYRRVPVDEKFFGVRPDVLIITHSHLDHLDPKTLDVFFSKFSGMTVIAPPGAYEKLLEYGENNDYVAFTPGTRITVNGVTFSCVKAAHSDYNAIGCVIKWDKTYYVTGDTLYNDEVIAQANKFDPEVVFLPVNGKGNNMNFADASEFLKSLGSPLAVPLHVGLFDSIKAENFGYKNKVVPEFYKKINI